MTNVQFERADNLMLPIILMIMEKLNAYLIKVNLDGFIIYFKF